MKRKGKLLLLGLLTLLFAIVGSRLLAAGEEEDRIKSDAMIKMLEGRYAGEVTSIRLVEEAGQEVYKSTLERKNDTYEISSDARYGQVMRISLLQGSTHEPKQAVPEKPQTRENIEHGISLDQARIIAMEQVEGVFDGIEVEEANGTAAYEVEIDTAEGREVKVLVNAYTGEIVSVLWED